MMWNKKWIISVVLFIVAATFTSLKLQEAAYLEGQYKTTSVRLKSEGMKEDMITKALENEKNKGNDKIPEITSWVWLDESEVKNEVLSRSERPHIILFQGSVSETVPMQLAAGSWVYEDDKKGCLIDQATVFRLFGTEAAVGNSLTYQNKNYYIRGIIKTIEPVMILAGNAEALYPNLEFKYQEKWQEQGETLTTEFLFSNGLVQEYILLDARLYGKLLHSLLTLPIWIFFLIISYIIMKYLWRKKSEIKLRNLIFYCSMIVISLIGYGFLLYQFTGCPIYFPDKFIPSKFSYFPYWNRLWNQLKEQLKQIRYYMPNPKDVKIEKEITGLGYNLIVMILLYVSFIISINGDKKNQSISV